MTDNEIPPMEPLAPVVDQMREIAQEEIPGPRSCRIQLWDDGTFDAIIYYSGPEDEYQCIRYERTTSEILWEHARGANENAVELTGGETIYTTDYEETDIRVITTTDPPY